MSFYPRIFSLQQATEEVWHMRHLFEGQALDPMAATVRLNTIWDSTRNPCLRRLILTVMQAMFPTAVLDALRAEIDEAPAEATAP